MQENDTWWLPVGGPISQKQNKWRLALAGNIILLSWFDFFVFYRNENMTCKNTFLLFKIKLKDLKIQYLKIK